MYSEDDINSAVDAGALSEEAAASFRAHMTEVRGISRGDEENFKLLNSFNDIFVAIGICIMLFAAGAIGQQLGQMIVSAPTWPSDPDTASWVEYQRQAGLSVAVSVAAAAGLVALTAWPLAEFFTLRRRMALPSIILLLGFVAAVFVGSAALGVAFVGTEESEPLAGYFIAGAGVIAAIGAWVHWARFKVPITVAAGSAALAATLIGLIMSAIEPLELGIDPGDIALWLTFVAGLGVFALAMRWDLSDPERTTRRSDVAFWLHLLAAPMIAHPVFYQLGVVEGYDISIVKAIAVLAIYIAFGIVALIVDRRALLVSALIYVLFALTYLFEEFGAVELTVALTALVIGSALLTLSAFWAPIRSGVLGIVPEDWRDALPSSERDLVAA